MNKKGIELSINFIVVLIIAVAVFSMGLVFLRLIITQGDKMKDQITKETEKEIEKMLLGGEKVAIPKSTKTVDAGDSVSFAIGILNVKGSDKTFTIEAYAGPAYTDSKTSIQKLDEIGGIIDTPAPFGIENNEHEARRVFVIVPGSAIKGTYVVNIDVKVDGSLYDGYTHKLYIKVR